MLHGDMTRRVLRCFYGAHWELGGGYLELICARALAVALDDDGVAYRSEAQIPVSFRGRTLACFRADFLAEERVIVEAKAVRSVEPDHVAQRLNSLRATDVEVGLLLNFGVEPRFRRLVHGNARKSLRVHPRTSAANPAVRIRGEA